MHIRIQIPLPWKAKTWSPNDDTIRYDWRSLYIHISTLGKNLFIASGAGFRDFK